MEFKKVFEYTVTNEPIFENIFTQQGILMNHVVLEVGKVFPKHPTDADVYALVTRGALSAQLEDEPAVVIGVGQVLHIPMGVQSSLGNGGDDPVELFVVKHQPNEAR